MSFTIKLNKSKNISFRVNPYSSSTSYTIVLPGVTIGLRIKRSKKKSVSIVDSDKYSYRSIYNVIYPQLQPLEYSSHIDKLSKTIKVNTLSNCLIPCLALSLIPAFMIISLSYRWLVAATIFLIGLIGIILKIYVHTTGKSHYDTLSINKELPSIWDKVASSDKLWHLVGINELGDKAIKGNGGITVQYERIPTKIKHKAPFYIRSNSKVLQIKLENETLVILPDHYFLVAKSKVGILEASNLIINSKANPYAETEAVPKDTKILHSTWRYLNKDGSKDKRYKDNVQIPICEYGLISLEADSGFKILLLASKYDELLSSNYIQEQYSHKSAGTI